MPKTKLSTTMVQKAQAGWCRAKNTISPAMTRNSAAFSACRAGRMMGAPLILPFSLAKAIREPAKVMAPMATPSDISTRLCVRMAPSLPMPKASGE